MDRLNLQLTKQAKRAYKQKKKKLKKKKKKKKKKKRKRKEILACKNLEPEKDPMKLSISTTVKKQIRHDLRSPDALN